MEAKYQRIKIIGKGSFGKAFLVRNTEADALCVVKQMETGVADSEAKNEAVKEALMLKKLEHPNIISLQEVFMTRKGRLCIVMDYADGGDLSNALKAQAGELLPEAHILAWFVQMCFALLHVHDRKVMHRDLKPQNIFLMADGRVRLGDFGIARVLETFQCYAKTMVGTPYYLSPEIIQERPYAYKADVWSGGVVLFETATLRRPFEADSLVFLAGKILNNQASELDASYSDDLRALVKHMMTKPEAGRPTIREILNLAFLAQPMTDANTKYSLGLNLSEFAHGQEPPTPTSPAEGDGDYEDNFDDYSGGSSEEEQPDVELSQSAANLKLPKLEGSEDKVAHASCLTAKLEVLRAYLQEQTSEAEFQQVKMLVQGVSGVGKDVTQKLRKDMGEAIGTARAQVLLPLFQMLVFLEGMATSAMKDGILDQFRKWDVNGDGVISQDELQRVLQNLGMTRETVLETFTAMDANKDGKIDYQEFVGWLYRDSVPKEATGSAP